MLIVDDNEDAAFSLGELVHAMGHDPIVVYDGEAALQLAPQSRPHVALLDLGMPGIDGYELAKRLRMLPKLQSTLMVAVSGSALDDPERVHQAGFSRHLLKPVEPNVLASLLDLATPSAD